VHCHGISKREGLYSFVDLTHQQTTCHISSVCVVDLGLTLNRSIVKIIKEQDIVPYFHLVISSLPILKVMSFSIKLI